MLNLYLEENKNRKYQDILISITYRRTLSDQKECEKTFVEFPSSNYLTKYYNNELCEIDISVYLKLSLELR